MDAELIQIKAPRWKERTVGIASYRIKAMNHVEIMYTRKDGTRSFPNKLRMSGEQIRSYPTQIVGSGVVLYLVPIVDFEVVE